ncbi:cation diffusion facilitator family transporter [Adlercreutzia murintestinalis]|uniref:cation diffusion facilitator family transporter n=1 Tax=Adlercreutzia murintestinalis TaxID=2941325 RepID=UPI00203F8B0A|nr:cation diffusion facilitator family transporter [Adlercreutzia murintestinalis]
MEQAQDISRNAKRRESNIVQASIVGIVGNVVLVAFKLLVGLAAHSIAIILDAVNNATDVLSSVITIIGTKLAARRASRQYPFGFGRMEYMTSLAIAVIILIAGGISLWEAAVKVIWPTDPDYSTFTLIVIIASILVKVGIGIYLKRRGKTLRSSALSASGVDSDNDAILTAGTLVAALVALIWQVNIDGAIGVIISLFVLKSGCDILREAVSPILGARCDNGLGTRLKSFISSYDGVLGTYDIILDDFGPNEMIGAAHIEVDDDMRAAQIHELTRRISEDVYREFRIIITIGVYAANPHDRYKPMRRTLHEIVEDYPDVLQVHGFYVDEQRKLVTFDLVLEFRADNEAVRTGVIDRMKSAYPAYEYNVVIDADYVG